MHSKSPCRRRDDGFRSADEDDSESWEFRDLKKYYVYRYACPIKDVKKRRTKWRGCRLFYFLFCTVYCSENRLKINISFFLPIRFKHRGGHQTGFGIQVQRGGGVVE